MILSSDIPAMVAHRKVALELLDCERKIAANRNATSATSRKIMPSLIAKRDRLRIEVARLKIAADAAEREAMERQARFGVAQ